MKQVEFRFRPIQAWPGSEPLRRTRPRAPFSASYTDTLDLLRREVGMLTGPTIVDALIQLALPASQIRRDGLPYATSRPEHPGVILSFASRYGVLTYATDKYVAPSYGPGAGTPAWQHNLRAIALSLEALRKVDRYGVSKRGEQYAGWAALTSGSMTVEDAVAFIGRYSPVAPIPGNKGAIDRALRAAALVLHPDHGGDGATFDTYVSAKAVLEATYAA